MGSCALVLRLWENWGWIDVWSMTGPGAEELENLLQHPRSRRSAGPLSGPDRWQNHTADEQDHQQRSDGR